MSSSLTADTNTDSCQHASADCLLFTARGVIAAGELLPGS